MKKLKKPTTAILMATLIFSNMQLCLIYGDKVENIGKNRSNQIVEKNYKNTNKEGSAYIKNYVSKSKDANAVVNIPDANLKKGIYETLGKQDNETITKGELESITYLHMPYSQITNLEGIQYCINLGDLYLEGNNISDISALSNLTGLDILGLDNNNISDISPISTSLKHNEGFTFLTLSNNNISDISVLSNLHHTDGLDLSNNKISDISPLSNARIVRGLDLSNNKISDISSLNIYEVYEMNLSNNQIKDVSVFSNSEIGNFLGELDLSNNNITDISSLSSLEWIHQIDLSNNNISDITPFLSMNTEYNGYNSYIDLTINPIDLNNSKNMEAISYLENLGYEVYCDGLNKLDKPVIMAEDKIIMLGDTFNELSGVTAKDKDGVDITDKIEVIENDVWPTSLGVYDVIYRVTDSQGRSTIKRIKVTVTKKIEGIDLGEGNGTESKPLEVLLQEEKAIDELVSKLENSFEYSIVGEPVIKGDYKIYKIKLNDKTVVANEYVKSNENTSYIELKVNINNTNLIDKLDKIFIKDNDDSNDVGIISPIPPQEEIKFNDVKDHWAEETIETFIKKGYINGYEDNTFKPDNNMKRAEFVKVVNKVFGYTQKGTEEFTDVNKDDWFYNDICIGIKEGYIKGKSTDIFAPNDNITREEVAMILTNIMKNKDENLDKLNTFKDGNKTSQWAQSSVEGAIEAGYINGYEDKTIRPNGNITRAEAISMLSRVKK